MLVCLTAHQRTTPLEDLEQLSVLGDRAAAELARAHEAIRGAVVLATCNRFEAYFDVADAPDASPIPAMDAAMERISGLTALPFRRLRDTVDFAHGNGVAQHLFSVAAGLDSVAVGEDEISGQVGRALEAARRDGATTAPLEHLFQRATETSRAVKNSTRLGESGRSLVRLAVELAGSRVGAWEDARVLLVGTGRYAAASLAALRAVGATDVRVHSPSGRNRFAERENLVLVTGDRFAHEAAEADVIVTCTTTTADAFVLTAEGHRAARASAGTAQREQLVIDLGMPRNVDSGLRSLDGVEVLDLDTIRVHAPIDEFATIDEARLIVQTAAQRHATARRVHEVAPAVVDMRAYVHDVLGAEIARARSRGAGEDTEAALRHFSGALLHGLIAQGHALASAGDGTAWRDAVATVFPDATRQSSARIERPRDPGRDLG
ncbi:glutamyl-tRNA reductase [Microbacterium dextranolyticum]|uniref:Glutamyl-tRNA reductase n=1 Tax=Microbacterium dextranolyticum TaxID=36806 RepID=A0A9W6M643_9MICO|nr:glutamyl-tRNA reductase [Microbacterium dextranolyticum]MBM7463422.1 glutamyl-tRNA reductase [Microbacterium dextranolyticum]GLJ95476.1 glutamyl-tRNA reductase [Microbacterium dextranolyticum]